MTYTEILEAVLSRLNLSTSNAEATARIGQEINSRYRRICTTVNLITSSRITVQANCTPGVSTLEFPGIEKIVNVQNRTVTPWLTLGERMYEQLEQWRPSFYTLPTFYAIERAGPDSVTILINAVPETALTLYAEGWENKATLSGSDEPDFAEAYHEVLVFGALADEYRKMMKTEWARDAETQYNGMLSDLRMFLAKSSYLNVGQRMFVRGPGFIDPFSSAPVSGGGGGGGSTPFNGAQSWTQTGLITFDRAGLQPFEIVVGTLKVDNLDADKLDGQHGAFYQDASNLNAGIVPLARIVGLVNANIDNAAAIAWTKVSKAGSSLADLTTRSASDVSSGTLPVARLAAGTFTVIANTVAIATNNWAPAGMSGNTLIEWSGGANAAITGLAGGVVGQLVTIKNIGSFVMTFAHNSGSSSAGNKFLNIATSAPTPIAPRGYATYQYDGSQWELVGHDQGSWITPTFAAGDYTGNGSMTWTVAAGDASIVRYKLSGTTMSLAVNIVTSTVGGSLNNQLQIGNGQWGGFSIGLGAIMGAAYYNDNGGALTVGLIQLAAANVGVYKAAAANWSAATDTTYVYVSASFEIT